MSLDILSRAEAVSRGLRRYFTGKPCPQGHVAERSVYGGCVECARLIESKRNRRTPLRKKQNRAWRESNGGRAFARRKTLAEKGVDTTWYEAKLTEQGGACAICGTTNPGKRRAYFSVDHDHATGAARGLLCSGCNVSLGGFADSVSRLRAAAAYLEQFA